MEKAGFFYRFSITTYSGRGCLHFAWRWRSSHGTLSRRRSWGWSLTRVYLLQLLLLLLLLILLLLRFTIGSIAPVNFQHGSLNPTVLVNEVVDEVSRFLVLQFPLAHPCLGEELLEFGVDVFQVESPVRIPAHMTYMLEVRG